MQFFLQRGRIVCVDQVAGAGFRRNDRVTVDVFLVDVGKTIKNVDLNSRIRYYHNFIFFWLKIHLKFYEP